MFAALLASVLLAPTPIPTPSSTISPLPAPVVEWYAVQGAAVSGLDAALVRAVIDAESGGDPRAVSSAGAVGMMQLEAATAYDCGIRDRFDALANVECGSRTLGYLIRRYGIEEGLESYNFGAGNVAAVGGHFSKVPQSTQQYVKEILLEYDELQHIALAVRPPAVDSPPSATQAWAREDALGRLWPPANNDGSSCDIDAIADNSWRSFDFARAYALATLRMTSGAYTKSVALAREETD